MRRTSVMVSGFLAMALLGLAVPASTPACLLYQPPGRPAALWNQASAMAFQAVGSVYHALRSYELGQDATKELQRALEELQKSQDLFRAVEQSTESAIQTVLKRSLSFERLGEREATVIKQLQQAGVKAPKTGKDVVAVAVSELKGLWNQIDPLLKPVTQKSLTPREVARLQAAINRFAVVGVAVAELFAASP